MSGGREYDSEFAAFLRALKQRSDIVEVIRSYVAVDRKGGNYWACCPFHHEKTPSFAVNESEQFYHCFGCQESGDVIKFVQEIESTDFMGAVRILAARAKMTVPETKWQANLPINTITVPAIIPSHPLFLFPSIPAKPRIVKANR